MTIIGFGTNNHFSSKIIRRVSGSKWSHVWIEYPSGVWGGQWVVQSWPEGVVKVPLEKAEKVYPTRINYVCNADLTDGFSWARKYIRAGYDYGVIWNMLLLVLYKATKWKWLWKITHRNAARFTCSELVAGFLKAAKVSGTEDLTPEFMTPGDLEKFCSESPNFEKVKNDHHTIAIQQLRPGDKE